MTLFLLLSLAQAGTTTESFSTGWTTDTASGTYCNDNYVPLSAEADSSITFTTPQIVRFENMDIDVHAQHRQCYVYLDTAELDFNGYSLWSKTIDQWGGDKTPTDWYIKKNYTPADTSLMLVGAGTYDITATLDGEGDNNNNKIRIRYTLDVTYGRDWDDDGYDSDLLALGTDCDDQNSAIHPMATEVWYDGIDQNCDGLSDYDQDGDGEDALAHGGLDCDDENDAINTTAIEVWYDGIDQNCDGLSDYDQDGDGEDSADHFGTDCDDEDGTINTTAEEIWYDGVDQNCDALSDYDQDGDGADSDEYAGTDCDDVDPNINPDADEIWYDGVDQNCDALSDYDQDGDGADSDEYAGTDCDDVDPNINPDADEIWYDGVDQNCDGLNDYDQDGDGYEVSSNGGNDCDDTDPTAFPGAQWWTEDCDYLGVDDGTRPFADVPDASQQNSGCQCTFPSVYAPIQGSMDFSAVLAIPSKTEARA